MRKCCVLILGIASVGGVYAMDRGEGSSSSFHIPGFVGKIPEGVHTLAHILSRRDELQGKIEMPTSCVINGVVGAGKTTLAEGIFIYAQMPVASVRISDFLAEGLLGEPFGVASAFSRFCENLETHPELKDCRALYIQGFDALGALNPSLYYTTVEAMLLELRKRKLFLMAEVNSNPAVCPPIAAQVTDLFSRVISVSFPDKHDRKHILKHYVHSGCKKAECVPAAEFDLNDVVKHTDHMAGRQLKRIVDLAVADAVLERRPLTLDDLQKYVPHPRDEYGKPLERIDPRHNPLTM